MEAFGLAAGPGPVGPDLLVGGAGRGGPPASDEAESVQARPARAPDGLGPDAVGAEAAPGSARQMVAVSITKR
ncbi:hypothetical protein GCM10010253_64880 [Streptomyces badius]|uniref:Uncharacterized protein n=1 Tax=Streptomyces badius TaxID=1941 RepID=A0ABQ2TQV8_STRBA|nr:hypothetical protein GCM10010253_64880 [Streptomyces badius]